MARADCSDHGDLQGITVHHASSRVGWNFTEQNRGGLFFDDKHCIVAKKKKKIRSYCPVFFYFSFSRTIV